MIHFGVHTIQSLSTGLKSGYMIGPGFVWTCSFQLEEGVGRSSTGICSGPYPFSYLHKRFGPPDQLSNNVLKFADDTKLYGVIDNQFHGQNLQKDNNLVNGHNSGR